VAEVTNFRSSIYDQYSSVMQDRGEAFDIDAARRWGKAYDYFLRGWLPENKDAAIADVACGCGQLLLFFKDRGFAQIAGVDVSPPQIKLARQVIDRVEEQDILTFLAERPDSFDLITGMDIIEHLPKDVGLEFLRECHSALRPGGRLILQTPNLDSPLGPSVRYGDFTHETGFTPDILERLMRFSGFEDIKPRELGPVRRGYSLASSVRYVAWRALRFAIELFNTVETGARGSGVHSRVFLISGRKS
jgi:SAM-dependent methyltransferase